VSGRESRHLGVDTKTLHRWLAEARLSLHCHPHDGRKKGLSEEHLQVLARLHQRSLTSLPEVPPAPVTSEVPPLPAELLALPQQLSCLQAQISTLQQQLADLSRLLPQQVPPNAGAAAPTKPSKTRTRSPEPAPPAPHARPVATTPPRPVHVIPRVEYGEGGHYVVICPKRGVLPFEPDSPEWFAWVAEQDSFRFVGQSGHFSAHHEWRIPKGAWRTYRKIRNRNSILRLAPNHELTIAVLEQAAAVLQAQVQ
jgi:hypothetical protein